MKTRLIVIFAVLLALGLVLAACVQQGVPMPQDPVEAVKTIADKQKEVKTQDVDMNLGLQLKLTGLTGDQAQAAALFKNFKASANISGTVDNTAENFALKGNVDLGPLTALIAQGEDQLQFEAVKVNDKLYSKTNVGDTANQWNEEDAPKSTTSQTQTNPLSPEMVMGLLKQSSKAEKLADEKIDNVDTYHYKVTLDSAALIDSIANLARATDSNAEIDQKQMDEAKQVLKDAVFEIELWAGKQDLLLRQAALHFNLNLKDIPDQPGATALIDFTLQNKTSKINEPVNITAPK